MQLSIFHKGTKKCIHKIVLTDHPLRSKQGKARRLFIIYYLVYLFLKGCYFLPVYSD